MRTDLPQGPLTFGSVYQVLPFDNQVVQVRLKGSEVHNLVALLHNSRSHSWGPPSFSGLHWTLVGERHVLLKSDGQPIDADADYLLSTSDFLLEGGDGADAIFANLPADAIELKTVTVRDAVIAFLASLYPAMPSTMPLGEHGLPLP